MNEYPIATRAYVVDEGQHLQRWKIEGQESLFRFRVMYGRKQQPLQDEIVARFATMAEGGYSLGCFHPCDINTEALKVPVEKCEIHGESYIRISWGGNWHCFPGQEWNEEMEQEARKFLRQRRIIRVEFVLEDDDDSP